MRGHRKTKDQLIDELAELRQRIAELEKVEAERKRAEEALRQRTHDLGERVKELNCLYGISNLVEKEGFSLEELLRGIVGLIPTSWHYPEVTCARLVLEGHEFRTENFRESIWKQTCDIIVHGDRMGTLEVCYLEERPESDEGPFLKEERNLINNIAERLGRIIERKRAEETLDVSHRFLEIAYRHMEMNPLLKEYVVEVGNLTGCAAVGVRMLDKEGNIPYQAYEGFSHRFYELESPLSIKSDQCMCINVVKGVADPELPFYTEGGSFYMNGSSRFLATVSEEEKGQTRNVCNEFGYESVALVPIRVGKRILGLIHVADLQENMVPLQLVKVLEEVAMQLGLAIQRVWAEEALRESEEKYRELYETAPVMLYTLNQKGVLLDCNKALPEAIGYSKEEMIGKPVYDFETEESMQLALEALDKVVREGSIRGQRDFITRDGKIITLEFEGHIEYDEERKEIVIKAAAKDITDRKWAEEALSESEEHYRTIFESAPVGIFHSTPEGKLTSTNPALARILRYESPDELMAVVNRSNVAEALYVDPEKRPPAVDMALREEGWVVFENRYRCKDGDVITGKVLFRVVRDPDGTISRLEGFIEDITEGKRAEEKHRHLITALQDAYLILQERKIVFANEKLAEMSGYEPEELIGMDIAKIIPLHLRKRGEELFEQVLRGETLPDSVEGRMLTKSGIALPTESTIKSFDYEGKPSISLLIRDITERKRAEEALRESARRISELSITDELTGLYNRRHFYEVLETEMYRVQRYGHSLSVVMLDIDGFKEYNDTFGHTSGDAVLKSFAQTLKSALRKTDTAFRYGGDEFTIILPLTGAERARKIADRIRSKWLQAPKAEKLVLETPLGLSVGVAEYPENAETADGLAFLADTALYRSKREGGNKSTLVSDLGALTPDVVDRATLDQVYALSATVEAKDPYTYGHSQRVSAISEIMGKAIGLSRKELADLNAAGLLHDIGKVGVTDSILTKPDKPTKDEWKLIRKHSAEGAKIVRYVRELTALVPMIRHHHEWYDGTGYPDGLKGEDIPLGARILAIADAYDTMTTARTYRDVVSQEEALEELRRCSRTQFDPELVEAFSRAMDEAARQD